MRPNPALGFNIEDYIVTRLLQIICKGAPIGVEGLCFSVQHIYRRKKIKTPFKNNRTERKWVKSFFARHPILSVIRSKYLFHQRALLTEGAVQQ